MEFFRVSDEQVRQFHEDGYFVVRRLLDQEETDLLNKIAKADDDMENAHGRRDTQGGVSKLRVRNELYDDIYSACVRCERIVSTTEKLLGDEIYHFHHKMMVKEPRVGGAWEWHQDYGYWYQQDHCLYPDMASCLIAVDRATKENGCLQVLKGSHKCGRLEHGQTAGQTGADLERVEALLQRLELVYVELDPGDGLFFHCNVLHRSDQNRSPNPRWSLICCYNSKHNDPYREVPGRHPLYHPLERWPDEAVKEVGQAQWQSLQPSGGTPEGVGAVKDS